MLKIVKMHNTGLSLFKSVSAEFTHFFHRKITYTDEQKTIYYFCITVFKTLVHKSFL